MRFNKEIQNLEKITFDKMKEYICYKLDIYNRHIKGEIKLEDLTSELEYNKYRLNMKKVGYQQIINSIERDIYHCNEY